MWRPPGKILGERVSPNHLRHRRNFVLRNGASDTRHVGGCVTWLVFVSPHFVEQRDGGGRISWVCQWVYLTRINILDASLSTVPRELTLSEPPCRGTKLRRRWWRAVRASSSFKCHAVPGCSSVTHSRTTDSTTRHSPPPYLKLTVT